MATHGTYAKWHEDVHDHPKTLRLAAELVALGVPEPYATDVVTGQLHRLACWCLRDGRSGDVGHLTALRFAQIVRWDDKRTAPRVHEAWMRSGFIDPATSDEPARLHAFEDYFAEVLRHRNKRAPKPANDGASDTQCAGETRATPGRNAGDARATPGKARAEPGRSAGETRAAPGISRAKPGPRARAFGIRNTEGGILPTGVATPPIPEAVAPVGETGADAPLFDPPALAQTANTPPDNPAPTRELIEHWQRWDRSEGVEPHGGYGQHAKTLRAAWQACGEDLAATCAAIDAYRKSRDAFTLRQGHTVGEFGRTLTRWIRESRGTAPRPTLQSGGLADRNEQAINDLRTKFAEGGSNDGAIVSAL